MPEPQLTVAEYAESRSVCKATIYRLIAAGKLPATKYGRVIRIPLDAEPTDGDR